MLVALARYEEALTAYEEAIRLEPNDVSIWYKIGEVLTSLGRANEAQQAYEKADPIKLIQGRYD